MKLNNSWNWPSKNVLSTLLLPLLLLMASSCSHWGVTSKEQLSDSQTIEPLHLLTAQLQKLCFSGEGKARLKSQNESHQMSYQSQLKTIEGSWNISFYLPLRGSESLLLQWDIAHQQSIMTGGKFYQKSIESLSTTNPEDYDYLQQLFRKLPPILTFSDQITHEKVQQSCLIDPHSHYESFSQGRCLLKDHTTFTWQQTPNKLTLIIPISDNAEIIIENMRPEITFFKHSTFLIRKWEPLHLVEKWRLELFTDQCNNFSNSTK